MVVDVRTGSIIVPALAFGLSLAACVDESGADTGGAESGDATTDADASDTSASDLTSGDVDTSADGSTTDASDSTADGSTSADTGDTSDTSDGGPCTYPAGAVEPMALGEVLTPYAWPEAIRADGLTTPLALENAACDDDAVIDWTPRDVIVFISWPAW